MIHISELAYERIRHPSDLLTVGQQVEVAVLRVDPTDNPRQTDKIALSLRAVAKNPWSDAERQFPVGTTVKGRVTRLQPFGAFVELAPGLEGMVHISELGAGRRVAHPSEVLNVGDAVEATVLGVDPDRRRIALSLDPARPGSAEPSPPTADYARPSQGMGTLGDLLRQAMTHPGGRGKQRRP
jgi:small subunit ribosomal protein S1